MNLQFEMDEILTQRVSELKQIIGNISDNKFLNIKSLPGRSSIIFCASDINEQSLDFTLFRFKTVSRNINANFYEIWRKSTQSNKHYFLEKSYLHLYLTSDEYLQVREDSEFILLHSDPNLQKNESHYEYKIGPHLHLQFAPFGMPHSHVALDISSIESIMTDRILFNKSLFNSVLMIKKQFLEIL